MRTARSWLAGSLLVLPTAAAAAPGSPSLTLEVPPTVGWIGAEHAGPHTLMQVIPPVVQIPHAGTTIIYLNRHGATLSPGNNDSRTNRSTIVQATTQMPAFEGTDAEWNAIMACERTIWAQFDAQITDVDPGNVPHIESIMSGRAETAGMQNGVLGVSPFTTDCSVIPNSIVYTFTQSTRDAYGTTAGLPEEICEIAAQEIAHSFGLDHEYLASDPMTYLDYNGLKKFQNVDAQCGEYQARTCGLPGTGVVCAQKQNSVTMLNTRIGIGDPTPPTVAITSPANGATVPLSFTVNATAADNLAVTKVELYVDGQLRETKTAAPFSFQVAGLTEGGHALDVKAYDTKNVADTAINVTARNGAPPPPDPGHPGDDQNGDGINDTIIGGCSTGGSTGAGALVFALGLVGIDLIRRPRRRR